MFYRLTLGILATWRITHLLNAEDGPWDIVIRIRMLAGSGFWGQLLDCIYCLSVWVAAPIALITGVKSAEKILLWPALSAGAILVERITNQEFARESGYFIEEELGDEHDMLR